MHKKTEMIKQKDLLKITVSPILTIGFSCNFFRK
jgi:hypothetical protein